MYKLGFCIYGPNCRYKHTKQPGEVLGPTCWLFSCGCCVRKPAIFEAGNPSCGVLSCAAASVDEREAAASGVLHKLGFCIYGPNCRYKHTKQPGEVLGP
jgi:predicted NUDIX family NTP pyrophosphohydrolase